MYGWGVLAVAIAFEIAGTTFMKLSDGFTRVGPSVALFLCYGVSFAALTLALRFVDIGVAYAIWSGIGTAAIAAIGMVAFGEPFTAARVFWIGVIVAGVVGLQLSSAP
jgi:small multidrug resistance pump